MAEPLDGIIEAIRSREYDLRRHYWEQFVVDITRPSPKAIIASIGDNDPELIETYPDDPRGASCLILGTNGSGNKIHTVVAYWCTPIRIVTAYVPSDSEWIDCRVRKIDQNEEQNEEQN
jgi:hypothetical protein